MSLDFGKLAFSTSFEPTAAFPLDARSYFESLTEAKKAAKTAKEAGSSDSIYYYGQTIIVVEKESEASESPTAKFYIIQPGANGEGVLSPLQVQIDEETLEFQDGHLTLRGFLSATSGCIPIVQDGKLEWIHLKSAIAEEAAALGHLKRVLVSDPDLINLKAENAESFIYMVPNESGDRNNYDEYMVVTFIDQEGQKSEPFLEKVGSWEVSLDGYVQSATFEDYKATVDTTLESVSSRISTISESLSNYVEKDDKDYKNVFSSVDDEFFAIKEKENELTLKPGFEFVTPSLLQDLDDMEQNLKSINDQLATISTELESNKIKDYNTTDFSVDENGKLSLNDIAIGKVNGLEAILNEKASLTEMNDLASSLSTLQESFNSTLNSLDSRVLKLENNLIWTDLKEGVTN